MTYFLIFFFIFILFVMVLIVGWTIKNGISPMPTSYKVCQALFENLPQQCRGTIYELGSGWGTLAFPLARKYPHCMIIAYENSPIPYFYSKIRLLLTGHQNLLIMRADFFRKGLDDANLVICYLYPAAMVKLKDKFEKELPKGTLVVSHTFAVPGWKPQQIIEVPDIYHSKIYFYDF